MMPMQRFCHICVGYAKREFGKRRIRREGEVDMDTCGSKRLNTVQIDA
jgi:hypothetical protein